MKLTYWEKQFILYCKGHYSRMDINKDIKYFSGKEYGLSDEHVDQFNINAFVFGLYDKLKDNRYIKFNLNDFLQDVFKRGYYESTKPNYDINWNTVLRKMCSDITTMKIKFDDDSRNIELGEVDGELYNKIDLISMVTCY